MLLITAMTCAPEKKELVRDGIVREYHKNGKLLSEINYKNGKIEGLLRSWYDNGQLHDSAYFEKGKVIGYAVAYYRNGNKNREENWNEHEVLHGLSQFWYEDGVLGDSGWYYNGSPDREWRRYHKNGQLQHIKNYAHGKLNGKSIFLKENGDTIKVQTYNKGEIIESKDY